MIAPIEKGPLQGAIPAQAGIGLRAPHYQALLETLPAIGWLEVHSENYFGEGGAPLHYLEQARSHYPISLHGVGLSLGSTDPLNRGHLEKLKTLVTRIEPVLVSEHLCWSSVGGRYLNDLLPLPYTEEAMAHVSERVSRVQEFLGRPILIENLSSYLEYRESSIPEWEFVREVARRAGCGVLLDVNNVYVSSRNHGFDPRQYIDAIPAHLVQEIHLAGFTVNRYYQGGVLSAEMHIDTHNQPVSEEVWHLYRFAIERIGTRPTLIEWDTDLPGLAALLREARKADHIMGVGHVLAA